MQGLRFLGTIALFLALNDGSYAFSMRFLYKTETEGLETLGNTNGNIRNRDYDEIGTTRTYETVTGARKCRPVKPVGQGGFVPHIGMISVLNDPVVGIGRAKYIMFFIDSTCRINPSIFIKLEPPPDVPDVGSISYVISFMKINTPDAKNWRPADPDDPADQAVIRNYDPPSSRDTASPSFVKVQYPAWSKRGLVEYRDNIEIYSNGRNPVRLDTPSAVAGLLKRLLKDNYEEWWEKQESRNRERRLSLPQLQPLFQPQSQSRNNDDRGAPPDKDPFDIFTDDFTFQPDDIPEYLRVESAIYMENEGKQREENQRKIEKQYLDLEKAFLQLRSQHLPPSSRNQISIQSQNQALANLMGSDMNQPLGSIEEFPLVPPTQFQTFGTSQKNKKASNPNQPYLLGNPTQNNMEYQQPSLQDFFRDYTLDNFREQAQSVMGIPINFNQQFANTGLQENSQGPSAAIHQSSFSGNLQSNDQIDLSGMPRDNQDVYRHN
ncbi:hypothetical protein ABW19_dt0201641 [Dactylella cylindrospora]|nr:hypothetical protein ABW19_dt0201641 [Dactylella cylindrospora]